MKKSNTNEENRQYQPNYKPCPYSAEEIKDNLWRYGYKKEAIQELERVAENMFHALQNEETPDIVKDHIKQYFYQHIDFDLTKCKLGMSVLYVFGCRRIPDIPFAPSLDYIETLTGNDKEKAIQTAEEAETEEDFVLFKSISEIEARELAENIVSDIYERQDVSRFLASLVYAIGNELHPIRKEDMVDAVIEVCFTDTMLYGKEYWSFVRKVANYNDKEEVNAKN